MIPPGRYALVAVSNLNRAASFKHAIADVIGLDIVLVRDGDEAMQEVGRRGLPALLVIDLSLPRVDGFSVVRRIRRQDARRDTHIIVVAAHESLRAAARELASSLGLGQVLPLDVDRSVLRDAVAAALGDHESHPRGERETAGPIVPFHGPGGGDADEIIERAAVEAKKRFRMPASVSYINVSGQASWTFHLSARDSGAILSIGDSSAYGFLRQVAETFEPLVIPNVENHPVFAQLLSNGAISVRGFAAVPVQLDREDGHAALCVLDTKPVTLTATDLDAFVAFGRQVGQELDRVVAATVSAPPDSRAPATVDVEDVKALQHLAATDPLTGLANRRGGEKNIANEISRAKRERRPLSCILLDIDRFKLVNDTYGHQAGDQLLRDVSSLLRRTVRAYDILVRWGGEEFLLVLPGVDLDLARVLAERVRVAIEGLDTHGIGPVTVSAGVAKFENDYDFAATLKTADKRLYQAKATGRNKVV